MSITCFPFALLRQSSIASLNVEPGGWMMKSTWHVVPPKAAAVCPDSTSSIVVVDVADVVVRRCDDAAAFDQNGHADLLSRPSSTSRPR
jgi:hypothetical protein